MLYKITSCKFVYLPHVCPNLWRHHISGTNKYIHVFSPVHIIFNWKEIICHSLVCQLMQQRGHRIKPTIHHNQLWLMLLGSLKMKYRCIHVGLVQFVPFHIWSSWCYTYTACDWILRPDNCDYSHYGFLKAVR